MISSFIDRIPSENLDSWYWWLSFLALTIPIVFTVIGGALGFTAMKVNDRIASIKAASEIQFAKDRELERQDFKIKLDAAQLLAEKALKPRPFTERLDAVLKSVNPAILEAIYGGNTANFEGELNPWQMAEIQKLWTEEESKKYMTFRTGPNGLRASTDGMMTDVIMVIFRR